MTAARFSQYIIQIYLMDIPLARTNRTRFVILGLLTDAPKSGYDIKREIEEITSHFWRESFGQIYPTLQRLCAEGLARKLRTGAGGRGRTTYTITPAGRRMLKEWLAIEPEPGVIRHELLLKIFFGMHTDPATLIAHVTAYRARVEKLQAYLQVAERSIRAEVPSQDQPFWMLPVRSGQLVAEAGVTWADEALTVLRRRARDTQATKRSA
ncbi:MAG: PadR family transcriptional regulator [Gemmatimonadaceae bacterium]